MYKILELRDKYKVIYSRYSLYIEAVLKFLIALVGMIIINSKIGTMGVLLKTPIVFVIAVVCAVVPKSLAAMILMLTIVAHTSSIAIELGAVVLVLFIIMYLLFFRFTSKESSILVCTPVLFMLNIPYVLPMILGLVATPVSIVSVAFGTVVYFILSFVEKNYDKLVSVGASDGIEVINMVIDGVLKNEALYFCIIAFAITLVVVYVVKRCSFDYSWIIAVCVGGIIEIITFLIGNGMFDLSLVCSTASIIFGGIISLIIAWFLQFFIHSVDYTRTEKLQFEDDDYYYYVKAVPKGKVSSSGVKVKPVNAAKGGKSSSASKTKNTAKADVSEDSDDTKSKKSSENKNKED